MLWQAPIVTQVVNITSGYHTCLLFQSILMTSTPGNMARLLSASAPHASSWLSDIPSVGLGLHLDPAEFQAAVKWWLGELLSRISVPILPRHHFGSSCPSRSVMQTWWRCGHQTQSPAKHFYGVLSSCSCICLYMLRLAKAF